MKSVIVLSTIIVIICKTEGKNDRKEKLEEYTRKIEKSLKYSKQNENENNKRKLNKTEIETDSESNNTICSSQSEEEMEIEDYYMNNGRYDVSIKLKKIDFKAMEVHI